MKKIFYATLFGFAASCGPVQTDENITVNRRGSEEFNQLAKQGRRSYFDFSDKKRIRHFDLKIMPDVAETKLSDDSRSALKTLGFSERLLKELVPAKNFSIRQSPKLISLNYVQLHDGLPVKDAFVEVVYARMENDMWRLREVVNQSFEGIEVAAAAVAPNFDVVERLTGLKGLKYVGSRSLIFTKAGPGGAAQFVSATEFDIDGATNVDGFYATVSNDSQELLEIQPKSHQVTTMSAQVLERSYFYNKMANYLIPQTKVKFGQDSGTTDLDGEVDIGEAEEVEFELTSPRVRARKGTASGAGYALTSPIQVSNLGVATIKPEEEDFRAVNSYLSIHRAISHALQFVAESTVPYFKNQVDLVFDYNGTCNAFYTSSGDNIRLYGAGGGCGAMALVNDVIFHEWGHGYDFHTGRSGGISNSAFSEGLSDVVAAYMTKSPNMAPGFREGREEGIRNLDNTKRYPDDQGEAHAEGTIIGGAFWDLRMLLVERFGENRGHFMASDYFYRHLLTTDTYLESYNTILRLDDNDGNAQTKSPNHCLISEAFAKHGLSDEAACQDDVPKLPTADLSIYFAFVDGKLAVSTKAESEMEVCEGDVFECLKSQSASIELVLDGQKNGQRIFVSKEPYAPKEQSTLTAITKDSQGKVLGFRSVKIAGK